MNHPIKRKKTKKLCPINVDGLLRKWDNGCDRIDGFRLENLYDTWLRGAHVNWRKLGPTFIREKRPINERQIREDARPQRQRRPVPFVGGFQEWFRHD